MDAVEAHVGSARLCRDHGRPRPSGPGLRGNDLRASPSLRGRRGCSRRPSTAPEDLQARAFTGNLAAPWRIASFSALARESEDAGGLVGRRP